MDSTNISKATLNQKNKSLDNAYFLLSGVVAIGLYALLILIIFFMLRSGESIKFAIKNPSEISSISVSLVEIPTQNARESKIQESKMSVEKQDKPKDSKKAGSNTPIAGLGVSELFQKIDTKKQASDKSQIADNRDSVASKKKSNDSANESDKLNEILNNTQNIMNTLQNLAQNASMASADSSHFCERNAEYCNKLQELLYSNWHIADSFVEKLESVVTINISKNGEFSYTIKTKSGQPKFDESLKASLEALKKVAFPTINGEKLNLDVNFTNKKESR